jgi:hypothetical protein
MHPVNVYKTFIKRLQSVHQTFTKRSSNFYKTFIKRLQNFYQTFTKLSTNGYKTFIKRLQNVHKTFIKRSQSKRFQNVLNQNVFKTFSIKTFSKRSQSKSFQNVLNQNVFKTFSIKTLSKRSLHTRFPTLVSPLGYTRFERFISSANIIRPEEKGKENTSTRRILRVSSEKKRLHSCLLRGRHIHTI